MCTHKHTQYSLQRLMDLVAHIQHLCISQITTSARKKSVESLYPSLVSGSYKAVFYTAQIVQMHHLSQS